MLAFKSSNVQLIFRLLSTEFHCVKVCLLRRLRNRWPCVDSVVHTMHEALLGVIRIRDIWAKKNYRDTGYFGEKLTGYGIRDI